MIKGCNKRVIVMKNTGHDMIEEAFFILKADAAKSGGDFTETDLVNEANRILDAKGASYPFGDMKLNVNAPPSGKSRLSAFLWGVVAGLTITCIFCALI